MLGYLGLAFLLTSLGHSYEFMYPFRPSKVSLPPVMTLPEKELWIKIQILGLIMIYLLPFFWVVSLFYTLFSAVSALSLWVSSIQRWMPEETEGQEQLRGQEQQQAEGPETNVLI